MAGGGELQQQQCNFTGPDFVVIIVNGRDIDDGPNVAVILVVIVDGRDIPDGGSFGRIVGVKFYMIQTLVTVDGERCRSSRQCESCNSR